MAGGSTAPRRACRSRPTTRWGRAGCCRRPRWISSPRRWRAGSDARPPSCRASCPTSATSRTPTSGSFNGDIPDLLAKGDAPRRLKRRCAFQSVPGSPLAISAPENLLAKKFSALARAHISVMLNAPSRRARHPFASESGTSPLSLGPVEDSSAHDLSVIRLLRPPIHALFCRPLEGGHMRSNLRVIAAEYCGSLPAVSNRLRSSHRL